MWIVYDAYKTRIARTMLPLRQRRHLSRRRIVLGVSGAAIATAVALTTPPPESLPTSLLPARVLLEGIGRLGRCVYVGGIIFFDYYWYLHGENSQEAWNKVHRRSAARLVRLAETNGGLYVKAGQIFANMSHILPLQYCTTMAVLQNAVMTRPFTEIVTTLERELGCPISDVFSYLDSVPLAAASLAQVHRGILKKDGTEVAVKVQYLDIAQRFSGDMRTIQLMLGIAGYFFSGYDLSSIVSKLNDTVANELDFTLEAKNCERAAQDLKAGGFGDRVVTPEVLHSYTTRRILITKLISNAAKISDFQAVKALGINPRTVATWFCDALAYQMFVTGFVHGDPHAGNVLVHRLPNGQPQVVLLDFGLCAELSESLRTDLAVIWTSSVTHDTPTLKKIAKQFGFANYPLFASCFLHYPYELYSASSLITTKSTLELMREHVRHKMQEINDVVSQLPKEYALVLRSLLAAKAINKELHEPVNQPLRLLRYSAAVACKNKAKWELYCLLFWAWWSELLSSMLLSYARWKNPELMQMFDDTLQTAFCG